MIWTTLQIHQRLRPEVCIKVHLRTVQWHQHTAEYFHGLSPMYGQAIRMDQSMPQTVSKILDQ